MLFIAYSKALVPTKDAKYTSKKVYVVYFGKVYYELNLRK